MAFKSRCQVALFHPRFAEQFFDKKLIEMQHWCDEFVGRYNQDWCIEYNGSKNAVYFHFINKSKGDLFALRWL